MSLWSRRQPTASVGRRPGALIGIPERKACHESSTVSAGSSSSIAPVTSSARTRTIDAQSYAIATEDLPYSPLFEPKTETDSSAYKISRRNPPCLAGAAESRTDDQGAVPLHASGGGIHGEASRVDTLMSATGELEPRPRSHVHSIRGLASIAVRPNNFLSIVNSSSETVMGRSRDAVVKHSFTLKRRLKVKRALRCSNPSRICNVNVVHSAIKFPDSPLAAPSLGLLPLKLGPPPMLR